MLDKKTALPDWGVVGCDGIVYYIVVTKKRTQKKEKRIMTVEEIRNLINGAEYDYIGVRADSREYQVGDIMDYSHQLFQDPQYEDDDCTELSYPYISEGEYAGFYDGGELDGTCALEVSENNIEETLERVKVYGKKFYLIAGNTMEYGNDADEIIIRDAEVIAVL